jgi:hypothetical protein
MITKKTNEAIDRELARMKLREMFAEQDRPTVYTVLRHVSQSGMSRDISLKTMEDGQLIDITYTAPMHWARNRKTRTGRELSG